MNTARQSRERGLGPLNRNSFVVWLLVALAVLTVDFVLFWGVWGGWVNYDTAVQWKQVQSGVYTQWHPFVHTFLMMKLPSLLWNDYRVTVLWQVLLFSLAFGYVGLVLQRIGARTKWVVLGLSLTLLHPQTLFFMMTPLKDSAFAIAVLVSVAALMPVVCRGAVALRELWVWCPLAQGLALASLFRHNGIFFSIPALVLVLVLCVRGERRGVVRFVVAFALLFGGLRFALPHCFDVRPASTHPEKYQFIESCGLPLSMMGAVYMKHPDDIPLGARSLLESIAPREVWFGKRNWSFNSVKHHGVAQLPEERIAGYAFTGWKGFAADFWGTVKVDPEAAIGEALRITGQVWNPAGHPREQFYFPLSKIGLSKQMVQKLVPVVFALSIPLFGVIGFVTWLCLFGSVWLLLKKRYEGLVLTLPILGYNVGTMFFLSGFAVYRFFFCNVLVGFLLLVFLLAEKQRKVWG